MAEEQREALRRAVYQGLTEPGFRSCFTAETPEGERPIVIALRTDSMSDVLKQALAAGGAANVAIPLSNAITVLAMTSALVGNGQAGRRHPEPIRTDCTVGLFLSRVLEEDPDGNGATYAFPGLTADAPEQTTEARALFAGHR